MRFIFHWIKKIIEHILFDWTEIYFLHKKKSVWLEIFFKHKYILTEYKHIFFEWQNSYKRKIFFWLNINIYSFSDKKILNIKINFCNISAITLSWTHTYALFSQCNVSWLYLFLWETRKFKNKSPVSLEKKRNFCLCDFL